MLNSRAFEKLQAIHFAHFNGQTDKCVRLIKEYGDNFFEDFKEYMNGTNFTGGDDNEYRYKIFADVTIDYMRITNGQ